jgi:hypothetical protein
MLIDPATLNPNAITPQIRHIDIIDILLDEVRVIRILQRTDLYLLRPGRAQKGPPSKGKFLLLGVVHYFLHKNFTVIIVDPNNVECHDPENAHYHKKLANSGNCIVAREPAKTCLIEKYKISGPDIIVYNVRDIVKNFVVLCLYDLLENYLIAKFFLF